MNDKKAKGYNVLMDMSQVKLTGNIIPAQWFSKIGKTTKNGNFKADLLAINILAEICYWYRLTVVRDEESGAVTGHKKKFAADKLQLNYEQMAQRFGSTRIACKRSSDLLVKIGAVIKDFRHITLKSGGRVPNCLFIEPCPKWIMDSVASQNETVEAEAGEHLTHTSLQKSKDMLTKNEGSAYEKVNSKYRDYHETTTDTNTAVKASVSKKSLKQNSNDPQIQIDINGFMKVIEDSTGMILYGDYRLRNVLKRAMQLEGKEYLSDVLENYLKDDFMKAKRAWNFTSFFSSKEKMERHKTRTAEHSKKSTLPEIGKGEVYFA
jgi:hypothetical protein